MCKWNLSDRQEQVFLASQSLAASLPMDQHKETKQEENGVLWNKTETRSQVCGTC